MEKVHHIAIIKTIHIYSQIHRHTHLDIQYTMCKCISCVNLFSNFSNWKFSNSVMMSCVHLAHSFMLLSVRCICFMYLLTSSQLLYFLPTAASCHLNSLCDRLLSYLPLHTLAPSMFSILTYIHIVHSVPCICFNIFISYSLSCITSSIMCIPAFVGLLMCLHVRSHMLTIK